MNPSRFVQTHCILFATLYVLVIKMVISSSNKTVADYYAGKSVFITGGTGFLGKVFIEKLLYSCPDIDKIYMLIREKKNSTINQRLKELYDDPLYKTLIDERPQDLKKVIPISGDVTKKGLEISEENEEELINKVSVVIHAAATTKFNEQLKVAWRTNVEGTKMVLDLARRMKRVEVFVHISTAYTNTNREVIEEVLYPPPANINDIYPFVQQDHTKEETLKLIEGCPNTYTFTKALTEHIVAENQAYMRTIIVRPSVVGPIKDGCLKGWLQNWYGGTAVAWFVAQGLNRVVIGHGNNIIDVIPVDYVVNLVVAAAAQNSSRRLNELKVYNCCTSGCNPIKYKTFAKAFIDDAKNEKANLLPLPRWYFYTKSIWIMRIIVLLFQLLPALIADMFLLIFCKKPKFIKLQYRVIPICRLLDDFTKYSWVIKADRTSELHESLSPTDKNIFPCDPTAINWTEYLRDYTWGVRHYLLKKERSKRKVCTNTEMSQLKN